MKKFQTIALALAAMSLHVLVRLHRALESALWEICPGAMTWTRNVIDSAHKAVCREQTEAICGRRQSAPKPKKLKPAVKPVSELPSSFPSHEARSQAANKLRARWDTAKAEYSQLKFGTPEWQSGKEKADEVFEVLMRTYDIPVRY